MRIVLFGAPGSGKGTQAALISRDCGIPHISTGDMLREAARNGTEVGRKAREFMERGALVPDQVMVGVVSERLGQDDARRGFILDGFPRTVDQARSLQDILEKMGKALDAALWLEVDRTELVSRLTSRRICSGCGAIYNLLTQTPDQDGRCDQCGSSLEQRADDRRETVESRLEVYQRQTAPLKEFYQSQGSLKVIQAGGRSPDEVHSSLKQALSGR